MIWFLVFCCCSLFSMNGLYSDLSSVNDTNSVKVLEKKALKFLNQADYENAYQAYLMLLEEDPCNQSAISALDLIGKKWLFDSERKNEEKKIYAKLTHCRPDNADYLFFYGRALYQLGEFDEAKEALERCLVIAPTYVDAEILIGNIAVQHGEYAKAKQIFSRYPENSDAQNGLKALSRVQKKGSLKKAREAHGNLEYSKAYEQYAWMIQDDSEGFSDWPAVLDAKSHTRPSVVIVTNYTDAKEDDPSLGVPVVKDYYFLNTATLRYPINDMWRLNFLQLYYHQRENDIYRPTGVNYSAYSAGGEITSQLFFAKYWRWDLSGRFFEMWGDQKVNFPFKKTDRFEPGTTLFYNDGTYLGVLNAHRESYIIKNFSQSISKLLATDYLTGVFGFNIGNPVRFESSLKIDQIFIHDSLHNWKNDVEVTSTLSVPIPRLWKYMTALYRFEHGHFDKLNPNYYSFLHQFRNTFGFKLHFQLTSMIFWDLLYEHRWQTTYDLFQPIGNFIFIARKQYLIANRYVSKIGAQYKDQLKFEIEGHYFYESLPYRDWNINGSLIYQF